MTRRGTAFRGQPALILLMLLGGWVVLRFALWEPPFRAGLPIGVRLGRSGGAPELPQPSPESPQPAPAIAGKGHPLRNAMWPRRRYSTSPEPQAFASPEEAPVIASRLKAAIEPSSQERLSPPARPSLLPGPLSPLPAAPRPGVRASHWSGDAWLLVRRDTTTWLTSGRPSFGRSQMGAVLRYRLAPSDPHHPSLYARASKALNGAPQNELAAGIAGRPIPAIPVSVAAEVRFLDSTMHDEVRPAVFAVSEIPAVRLPLGLRGEVYAEGGYVGGDYATAFIDGQARIERELLETGAATLRAGAGTWGGAQEDAERLDAGPTASLSVNLGQVQARIAADWRFRIAGNAEPSSGPALTISAGF